MLQLTKEENLQQAQISDLQLNPSAATAFIDRCEQARNKSNLPPGQTAPQEPHPLNSTVKLFHKTQCLKSLTNFIVI